MPSHTARALAVMKIVDVSVDIGAFSQIFQLIDCIEFLQINPTG